MDTPAKRIATRGGKGGGENVVRVSEANTPHRFKQVPPPLNPPQGVIRERQLGHSMCAGSPATVPNPIARASEIMAL